MALSASPRSLAMSALHAVQAWPVASQQRSRRNAMLACTSLTQRRMERQDVDDFLQSLYGTSTSTTAVLPSTSRAVAHG